MKTRERLTASKIKKIKKGEYFVYAPHKDSLDSKYEEIGIVSEKHIILIFLTKILSKTGYTYIYSCFDNFP